MDIEKKDLVIVGAGGCGREVLWQLLSSKDKKTYNILGFADDSKIGQKINGYEVIETIDTLSNSKKKTSVIICIGSPKIKKMIYDKLSVNENIDFPNFIADSVKYSDSVIFGKGCIICEGSILTVNVKIGSFVYINLNSTVGHDAVIGEFSSVYSSVNISGNVTIGKQTEIGTGTQIIQGKNIGSNTIVGAGSVVIRDIPDNCTAVGVPAKIIKAN